MFRVSGFRFPAPLRQKTKSLAGGHISGFRSFILDLLFPVQCLGCGQEGKYICPVCFEKIPLEQKIIYRAGPKKSPLTGLITAGFYNYPLLKEAIRRYKYDFVKGLARPLGQLMVKSLETGMVLKQYQNSSPKKLFLIPVPLHQKRLRWRGFNQAELLAQEISQTLNLPLSNVLERIKRALPQVKIKEASERKRNIKNVFRLRQPLNSDLQHSTIILIDDVLTTGATLKECAGILKKAGAKKIWGLVLARG